MPSFTTLFEDTSPILTYSSNWGAGTSETDPLADQYSASSFTLTQTQGSTMNLAFNGTGVSLIGAMRGNHGLYAVNIDGTQSASMNGSSSSNLFNQTLFENNSLQMGAHTLILSNLQGTFVDIDYVTITTQVGNNTEDLIVNTFQNTHPSFLYSPESDWYTPSTVSSFSGASGHATQSASALVRMSFQGDGIAVYGPVGHNQTSSYVVQIDDGQLSTFNAQQSFYRAQQIMFFASNLGGGPHTLTMRLGSAGGELAIDYVDVYTAPSLGGSFLGSPIAGSPISSGSSCETSRPSTVPPGILGALAGLAVVAFAGVLASVYLYWRLRRVTRIAKPDEGSRPWMEEPRPFRLQGATPVAATIATDNVYYLPSDISTSAVSPSAYVRSMTSHTRGNFSVSSTSVSNNTAQVNPPEYEEGILPVQGDGYLNQSRRSNAKLRNI